MARARTKAAAKQKQAVKKEVVAGSLVKKEDPGLVTPSGSQVNLQTPKKEPGFVKKDKYDSDASADESGFHAGMPSTPSHQLPNLEMPLLTPGAEYGHEGCAQDSDDDDDDFIAEGAAFDDDDEYTAPGLNLDPHFFSMTSFPNPNQCAECGQRSSLRMRMVMDPATQATSYKYFCQSHDPEWTMHRSKALKHFRQFKATGGNLNTKDLDEAERNGTIEVRYRRNPHGRSYAPMRLYWVRELLPISRAKMARKAQVMELKNSQKAHMAEQTQLRKAQRQADAERRKADKEREKLERKAEREAEKLVRRLEAKRAKEAAKAARLAGSSGGASVTSTPIITLDDNEVPAVSGSVPANAVPSASAAAPYIVKPEPGLAYQAGSLADSSPYVPTGLEPQLPNLVKQEGVVKEEVAMPLFR